MKHLCKFLFILILLTAACGITGQGTDGDFDVPGEIIAYISNAGWSLNLMNIETGKTIKITDEAVAYVRWSPDGERIAFMGPILPPEAASGNLFVIGYDGSNKQVLSLWENNGNIEPHPEGGSFPVWSPDGSRVAFTQYSAFGSMGNIFIISNGVLQDQITNNGFIDIISDWSPDGSTILFQSELSPDGPEGPYYNWNWYTMNSDGSDKQQIAFNDTLFAHHELRYSPDGKHIAFLGGTSNIEIYLMNSDGSNKIKITDNQITEERLSWSPDGNRIAFIARSSTQINRNNNIYVINIDGSGERKIETMSQSFQSIHWRPK